jgi:hypothetical protein
MRKKATAGRLWTEPLHNMTLAVYRYRAGLQATNRTVIHGHAHTATDRLIPSAKPSILQNIAVAQQFIEP